MAVTLVTRTAQRSGLAGPPGQTPPATLTGSRPEAAQAGSTDSRSIPLEKFVIEGGVPLSGTIVPSGNKNGALPILAACLLTDDEMILRNVPRISDVETMVALLGPDFDLVDARRHEHATPWQSVQNFQFSTFRRVDLRR